MSMEKAIEIMADFLSLLDEYKEVDFHAYAYARAVEEIGSATLEAAQRRLIAG